MVFKNLSLHEKSDICVQIGLKLPFPVRLKGYRGTSKLDLLLKVTLLILSRVATNIATTPMMQIKRKYCNWTLFIDDRTFLTLVTGLFPVLQNMP